ncbi:MAG TPA: hypothetical protein VGQ76_16625 [Thermoanaerobaculia bacterium]|jgi:proteasome lid subunit RPN8/RPN11|nr:hypothetical protein [Thermoanaerobaculia bacterium]
MLITFAWLLMQFAQSAGVDVELVHDPAVLSFCRVLVRHANAQRDREHGAFVVRTPEGITYFVAWPPSGEKDVLRWYGRFPEGTVAVLHTHEAWDPQASKIDRRAAQASGIPIYVLTPFQITKTTGGPTRAVISGNWLRR